MPQIVIFVFIALAVVAVWYLMARYVATLARLRDQDEAYWFRMALMVTPMLAWFLLITNTQPPRR